MPWLQIIELLLPILLQILEDSPTDQAVGQMKRGGMFARMRLRSKLQSEVVPRLVDATFDKLVTMSDEELEELCQMAQANKAARG